jgi:hypothetical protein
MKDVVDDLVNSIEDKLNMKAKAEYNPELDPEENFAALNNTEPSTYTFKGGVKLFLRINLRKLLKMTALKDFINQNFL